MQETAKINYVQYGKGSKKNKGKARPNGSSVNTGECGGSNFNAGEPQNTLGRAGNPHYPLASVEGVENLDIRKVNHVKLEAVCRNCGIKGHYEKVCMKKSTHLLGVPDTSTNSGPDYFDEYGEPVYVQTHMVMQRR